MTIMSTPSISLGCCQLYWCFRLNGDVCDVIDSFWPYLWNLFLLHSIYNPAMYMFSSSEFRRALPRATRKLINIFGIQVNKK
jgi:5-hydroxytryptamine receptor 1